MIVIVVGVFVIMESRIVIIVSMLIFGVDVLIIMESRLILVVSTFENCRGHDHNCGDSVCDDGERDRMTDMPANRAIMLKCVVSVW